MSGLQHDVRIYAAGHKQRQLVGPTIGSRLQSGFHSLTQQTTALDTLFTVSLSLQSTVQ